MLKTHLKISLRNLIKNKYFTFLNIAGMALGLFASLIVFLFVAFHLRTDTFHKNYDKLYRVVLDIRLEDGNVEHEPGISIAFADALKNDFAQIEKSAVYMNFYAEPKISIQNVNNEVKHFIEYDGVAYASGDLLEMLDFEFLAGDKISALNEPNSVVLTQKQAEKYFGNLPALGRSIRINNKADLKVTGVIRSFPPNTDFGSNVLISLPTLKVLNPSYQMDNYKWIGRNNWVFIQMAASTDFQSVESQLPVFFHKYLGDNFKHWHYHLQPLAEVHFDQKYGGIVKKHLLYTLGLVSAFIILIACINFINISTVTALKRSKEVGIRKILGGSKSTIFWQYILETLIVIIITAIAAFLLIALVLPVLNNWINSELSLQQIVDVKSAFTLFMILAGVLILAGGYPALLLSALNPQAALKDKITSGRISLAGFRKALVVVQFSISQVLIIGAVIVVAQMNYFNKADLGFDKETILNIKIPKSERAKQQALVDILSQDPAVINASLHHRPPMDTGNDGGYIKYNNRADWEPFMVRDRWADENYLETYGLKIVTGRNIVSRDSLIEILVNETFLKRLDISNPEEALGKTIYDGNSEVEGVIVGVVKDFHHNSLQNPIEPFIIYSYPEFFRQAGIKISTKNLSETIQSIGASFAMVFPEEVFEYQFLEDTIRKMYQKEQVISRLVHLFSVVSIAICCFGILGLSIVNTTHRTKEVGIRKILGASMTHIYLFLCKDMIMLIIWAFLISIPFALYFSSNWLSSFAYRISLAWWMFVFPGLGLLIIALFTISWHSIKAALVDPVKSLKNE